jgi:hypothetical protein
VSKGNWAEAQVSTIDGRVVLGADGMPLGFLGPDGLLPAVYGIGVPGRLGFGVGVCPEVLPNGMVGMYGYTDPTSENYGNYLTADGSVMVWIPAFYDLWGNGANGLPVNGVGIIGANGFASEAAAAAAGYALHRAFWDGGRRKSGFFIDKYQCSASPQGIAVSMKNEPPLSSSAAHNPFSILNGSPATAHHGSFAAAKTRGPRFSVASRFQFAALAELAYAHGAQSTNATFCAWYDAVNNWPKGNTNNALRDSADTSVIYASDGYLNCGLTGSGVPFAKTTHNGQGCGVADLNGNMWEICVGLTSNGTDYLVLRPSVAIADLTSGSTLATDAWGASGRAANYDNLGPSLGALTASVTTKLFGNAAAVFGSGGSGAEWTARCLGIPLAGGVGGTNAFGNDGLYDSRPSDMCPLSGGTWGHGSNAGVWALALSNSRGSSGDNVGFRAALYL